MSLKFTDVKPMIHRKILRNSMTQKLLESHMEIFQKEVEIRQMYISSCKAKIAMLDTLNLIEKMQLDEYSKDREQSIMETTKSLEEMDDDLVKDINQIQETVKKIKDSSRGISSQILYLNETIPKEGVATNYKIKYKDTIGGRCIP